MSTKSHFKHPIVQFEHLPVEFFNVNPGLQSNEKFLFVGEHVRAFSSKHTTQFYPFSKAKPKKQLVQIETLPVEQVLHVDMHLDGTPLIKVKPSSAAEQSVILLLKVLVIGSIPREQDLQPIAH